MGAFDTPTARTVRIPNHVASKGDDYEISDGIPQNLQ